MKHLHLLYFIAGIFLSTGAMAQVTIGSTTKPAPGALLDLKQDGTTTKGLGLPRVKLAAFDQLTLGTNVIPNANNAWEQHAGLTVYNISGNAKPECATIPDGLYVWDGAKWNGINTPTPVAPASLDVGTKTTSDLPSGRDFRPLVAQTFTSTWTPSNPLPYTKANHATFGGVSFSAGNITASPLAASPAIFSMTPDAMPPAEIATNPFRTKESTLTFDATNECGAITTKSVTLNQTNKALTVSTPSKEYTANAPDTTNTLTTNANWKLVSIEPTDGTTAIGNVRVGSPAADLTIGVPQTDYEQNNNAGKAATLTYDITVEASKARYSMLTFADASATKRFRNVTITVLQCQNVGISPSIEQWALTAGFTQTEIDDVKTTGTDSPILATGIQLHRDQSNNLFLSSNFGTNPLASDRRWMIHNLAATDFDRRMPRTGDDNQVLQDFGNSPSGATNYLTPLWAYPKASGTITVGEEVSTQFTNNPRLGRLYNWAAATNSRGGTTDGQDNIVDGEDAPTPQTATVQGICPNGWHLPSDVEWTTLEQELTTNTMKYSSTANIGGIIFGGKDWRGTTHGKAMKEICELYSATHQGTSNSINSTARPGFDVLLAGYAVSGSAGGFGARGYLWLASGNGAGYAWSRYFDSGESQVSRFKTNRTNLISVRCKKN